MSDLSLKCLTNLNVSIVIYHSYIIHDGYKLNSCLIQT